MEIGNTALNDSEKYKSFAFYRYQSSKYEISLILNYRSS